MKTISVVNPRDQRTHICQKYSVFDEARILDRFFFWKTAVLLADQTESKKPQLPETFSEPFCCLVCDLAHKAGAGPDAFRLDSRDQAVAVVEIKATITPGGFTDIKRDMAFDELYWLYLAEYASLRYRIYKFTNDQLEKSVGQSATARDRGTVNLKRIADDHQLQPIHRGYIGIVQEHSG